MYFILKNDILCDFESSLNGPTTIPREVNFIRGQEITASLDDPLVYTTNATAGVTMIDFATGPVPLMSKRFVDLFEASGAENLQRFPAVVNRSQERLEVRR